MNFDNDHLYEFIYRDRLGATVSADHPYDGRRPLGRPVSDRDAAAGAGADDGSGVRLRRQLALHVKLERIEPPGAKIKAPRILENHGKSPEQYPDSDW